MFLVFFGIQKAGVIDLELAHLAVLETTEDVLSGTMWCLAQKEVCEGHEIYTLRQGEITALFRAYTKKMLFVNLSALN